MIFASKKNKGFSLIEILIVVAIIGLLASAALASMNDVRGSARDTIRKSDLKQIRLAMEQYRNRYGTYQVAGAGFGDGGMGWFSYEGPSYNRSVARALYEAGYLSRSVLDDPLATASSPGYMIYVCGGGERYAVAATLEEPAASDISHIQTTCNGVGANGTYSLYNKNYAVTNE